MWVDSSTPPKDANAALGLLDVSIRSCLQTLYAVIHISIVFGKSVNEALIVGLFHRASGLFIVFLLDCCYTRVLLLVLLYVL